jgi:hypothetical protein
MREGLLASLAELSSDKLAANEREKEDPPRVSTSGRGNLKSAGRAKHGVIRDKQIPSR